MIIVYILLALIAALFAICVIRALTMRPTQAQSAIINTTPGERELDYGSRLGKMIAVETISDRESENLDKFTAHHSVLEQLFPNLHTCCERVLFGGSLLFRWAGQSKTQPILLMSHQDVVEAPGEWQHAPFGGEIIGGKVWGRGTLDTKGNLFAICQAIEELLEQGFEPQCDVYIAASCDEEIAGLGAIATAEYLRARGVQLALVLDEGGMIMQDPIAGLKGVYGVVGVLEKGYGDVKLVAHSGGGHASAPGKDTPLVRLGRMMARIDKKSPFSAKMNPTVAEMFRRFAPDMGFAMRLVLGNMWLFAPILPRLLARISPMAAAMLRTTIAFTTAKGSDGLNVLPQQAYVTANLRFIPHQDMDESLDILRKIALEYNIEVQPLECRGACPVVTHDSDAFRLVEQVMADIYPGVGVTPYVMTGGTDARHFTDICDNVLRFAPLYLTAEQFGGIHGLDENIDCAALGYGVDFFKALIKKS